MSKRIIKLLYFILLPTLVACNLRVEKEPLPDQPAALIISGGTIYTMDESQPVAQAVAVDSGKIVYVGSKEGAIAYKGPNTAIIDLKGQTMTPGIIEGHAHLLGIGNFKKNLDLSGTTSYQQLINMVVTASKKAPKGTWILGSGWHQSKWDGIPEPTVKGWQVHDALSEAVPDHPVFLLHASAHAGFANAKAMEVANITASTTFTDDGEIIKDAQGQPTGLFNERAMGLITQYIPTGYRQADEEALELAIRECLKNGITSFHDAGSDQEAIDLFKKFARERRLPLRLYVMLSYDSALLSNWFENGPEIGLFDNHLTIRSVKLYADGALGSRGAWLLKAYADRHGHMGNNVMPMETIYQTATQCLEKGFQLCTHAIGDRANREVLNRYQEAFESRDKGGAAARFRIEHAQHLHPDDLGRFAELGVIPSMQAIHMSSDRPWAIDRLGKLRIEQGAYMWQSLIQSGAVVMNGTDSPVEPVSPIACFYASVSRKTLQGTPSNGYEADQAMTREQALRSYTLNAAYGAFEDDIKGSIEVGKLADFTVFNQNLMVVPEEQLLETRVTRTIIGGRTVYLSGN